MNYDKSEWFYSNASNAHNPFIAKMISSTIAWNIIESTDATANRRLLSPFLICRICWTRFKPDVALLDATWTVRLCSCPTIIPFNSASIDRMLLLHSCSSSRQLRISLGFASVFPNRFRCKTDEFQQMSVLLRIHFQYIRFQNIMNPS